MSSAPPLLAERGERAAGEGGQPAERIVGGVVVAGGGAVGVVQLGVGAAEQVVLIQDIAVAVVAVLEAVGGGAGDGVTYQFWSITRPKRSRPVYCRRRRC